MSDLPIHLFNTAIIQTQSMGANVTSDSTNLNTTISFCIQAVWSAGATPIGTMDLQASNNGTTWTTLTGLQLPVSGNTGSNMWNIEKPAYAQVRLIYTRTSGSATLDASINAKRA